MTTKKTLLSLALLLCSCIAMAQENTEVKPYTGTPRGYRWTAELGLSGGISGGLPGGYNTCKEIMSTHGYQFTSRFFAGAGMGLHFYDKHTSKTKHVLTVPFYGHLRFQFWKKSSPYLDLRVGYSVGYYKKIYLFWGAGYRWLIKNKYGLFFNAGMSIQDTNRPEINEEEDRGLAGLTLRVGMDF